MTDRLEQWVTAIEADGFVISSSGCDEALIDSIIATSKKRIEQVMAALGDREIGIGSAAGYDELVQRSPGRWDLPISPQEFGVDERNFPWWPLVTRVLGEDVEHSFSGVVYSDPGTPAQEWHIDSPHESAEHMPAHAMNVMVALQEVSMDMGPTEFARGSHRLTNHLRNPALVRDELIYQHVTTSPDLLVDATSENSPGTVATKFPAGAFVAFDDRVMHRGLANRSAEKRYMGYFSYRKKGYAENTHFEAERSIFEETG